MSQSPVSQSPEVSLPHTLVLFDIDGTLVDVAGAGRRAFSGALKAAWDIDDDLADITFAGATDLGVLMQLQMRHPLPAIEDTKHTQAFFRAMEGLLLMGLLADPPTVYDGVQSCLGLWSEDPGVVMGLVTGNAMRCAHVKLECAGVDRSVFDVGGYGDEHHDRDVLARLAIDRAERGRGHPFDRVILVGDTPSDVVAAHAVGAIAVGVTTGRYDREALLACGAHVVLDSLASLRAIGHRPMGNAQLPEP